MFAGRLFCNLHGLDAEQGDRLRVYVMTLGSTVRRGPAPLLMHCVAGAVMNGTTVPSFCPTSGERAWVPALCRAVSRSMSPSTSQDAAAAGSGVQSLRGRGSCLFCRRMELVHESRLTRHCRPRL